MGFSPLLKCVERDCGQVDRVLLMTVDSWRSTFGIQRSANKHSGTSANTRMFTGRKPTADCRKPLLRPDHRIRVRCLHGFDEARISVGLPAFPRNVDPVASWRVFAIVLF